MHCGADYRPFLTGPAGQPGAHHALRDAHGPGEPLIAEKFRTGGGLSYADYPGLHAVMAEDSAAVNDASLVDTILPLTA